MKQASMAYTAKEIKDRNKPMEKLATCEGDKYPYGLSISLESDSLKKLGLDTLPKPGTVMQLTATVVVTSASLDQSQSGNDRKSLRLQIQKMALEKGASGALAALEKGLSDADTDGDVADDTDSDPEDDYEA